MKDFIKKVIGKFGRFFDKPKFFLVVDKKFDFVDKPKMLAQRLKKIQGNGKCSEQDF